MLSFWDKQVRDKQVRDKQVRDKQVRDKFMVIPYGHQFSQTLNFTDLVNFGNNIAKLNIRKNFKDVIMSKMCEILYTQVTTLFFKFFIRTLNWTAAIPID